MSEPMHPAVRAQLDEIDRAFQRLWAEARKAAGPGRRPLLVLNAGDGYEVVSVPEPPAG